MAADKNSAAGAKPGAAGPPPLPRPPPWYATLRTEPPAWIGKLLGVACILLVIAIWWFFTHGDNPVDRRISPAKLPSPREVLAAHKIAGTDAIIDATVASLWRVIKGFGLAALIGVSVGVIAASYRSVLAFFQPLVIFGRSVPISALLPVTFLFFGIAEKQRVMFIFLATLPFVFSDTVKAISLVPERYVETAQTLGASRWQIIRKVLFPLALPEIITGLRFMFGLAFGYILLAETIKESKDTVGLGYLINVNQSRSATALPYLMLILIAVLAYLLDWTIRFFQRQAFPYRKDL
ncbi:MAG TPA: ABC transporter permease [Kofleriaceae bacterium]|nr:ABC transporter permease [Kofleriaceae bacterium]